MVRSLIIFFFFCLILPASSISIPLCSSGSVVTGFRDTQSVSDSTTKASLCHDKKKLYVNWENIDQQIISTYTNCNDPLYKEDVVEIFLASSKSYPVNYWEI